MNGGQINGSGAGALEIVCARLAKAEILVTELSNPELRENALAELSKSKDIFQDLAPAVWNAFGSIAALIQEIVSIYPGLSPPSLTSPQSNRVCNALALLQCVASHQDTKLLFLNAHIPLYLYPFLNTTSQSKPFEFLRLTSLGVIGALVKADNKEVIGFLLATEIIPLCLRSMDIGGELSKTVATFIVQKLLLDDDGLEYVCTTVDRFFAVTHALNNTVLIHADQDQPSPRLLKHIIGCYLRLSEHPRACDALRNRLPDILKDGSYSNCLLNDEMATRWMQQLIHNITRGNRIESAQAAAAAGVDFEHLLLNL